MKNIFLSLNKNSTWSIIADTDILIPQNIYITNNERIKDGDWYLNLINNKLWKAGLNFIDTDGIIGSKLKKIVLTTDEQLIADNVQAIDDEFLNWFVKNPSCEKIEVKSESSRKHGMWKPEYYPQIYKIIIPKEEPNYNMKQEIISEMERLDEEQKQETLERAAERRYGTDMDSIRGSNVYDLNTDLKRGFIEGVKEMQKQMYSEEEVEIIIQKLMNDVHCGDLCYGDNVIDFKLSPRQWFKQYKKK